MDFEIKNDYLDEDKFICFLEDDLYKTLNGEELTTLRQILFKILNASPEKYLCINKNKPYIKEIESIIKHYEQKEIIAFIGRAGSGKDYQCNLLEKQGFKKLAFATALRDIAFSSLGLNTYFCMMQYNWFKSNKCITVETESKDNVKLNFREFLENLGTQGIRKYDNDFWCKCLIKTLKENSYKKVCISDMRFTNEYRLLKQFAKENGYIFKAIFCNYKSDRYQTNNTHESAKLSNWLVRQGLQDLDEITEDKIECFEEQRENNKW